MAKSTTHAQQILDHLTGNATWTAPASLYASLHTGDPGLTGASEVATGSYARVAATFGAADAARESKNTAAITFPQGGGDAAVTHAGLWTALTAGTFLRGGALTSGFTYGATVTPEFAINALVLKES